MRGILAAHELLRQSLVHSDVIERAERILQILEAGHEVIPAASERTKP
jgi:hypothetical protein